MTQTPADLAGLAARILELHRPWFQAGGTRVEHRVTVCVDDAAELPAGHECVRDEDRLLRCFPEEGEHQVLACVECRCVTEDYDPTSRLWPCPTALAVDPSLAGGAPGGASS